MLDPHFLAEIAEPQLGGFLPTTSVAIVAATGNIYSGPWYPIVIAAGTFVIGMLFVRETKDRADD